jgi:hypothetical protein
MLDRRATYPPPLHVPFPRELNPPPPYEAPVKRVVWVSINPARTSDILGEAWTSFSDVNLTAPIGGACRRRLGDHLPPTDNLHLHARLVGTVLDLGTIFEGWLNTTVLVHMYPWGGPVHYHGMFKITLTGRHVQVALTEPLVAFDEACISVIAWHLKWVHARQR